MAKLVVLFISKIKRIVNYLFSLVLESSDGIYTILTLPPVSELTREYAAFFISGVLEDF